MLQQINVNIFKKIQINKLSELKINEKLLT
jgi:hypothetical protein